MLNFESIWKRSVNQIFIVVWLYWPTSTPDSPFIEATLELEEGIAQVIAIAFSHF